MKHGLLRLAVTTLGSLLLGSCAAPGGVAGPAAPAPTYLSGDRWVYHVEDGFRQRLNWEETHEVTAASLQGITVRVTAKGAEINEQRTETWSAPGVVLTGSVFDSETRRFAPALLRYKFPLAGGDRWRQRLSNPDPSLPYAGVDRTVIVGGYEKVTTPAGTFDAIRMNVYMRLDDETFWRFPTECNYVLWYAPAIGATVREEKYAYYHEKGGLNGGGRLETQRAVIQLVSSTRGR